MYEQDYTILRDEKYIPCLRDDDVLVETKKGNLRVKQLLQKVVDPTLYMVFFTDEDDKNFRNVLVAGVDHANALECLKAYQEFGLSATWTEEEMKANPHLRQLKTLLSAPVKTARK